MTQTKIIRPMSAILYDMALGEEKEFPIEKVSSVRSACSTYSLQFGRKFKPVVDKETRRLTVVRIA